MTNEKREMARGFLLGNDFIIIFEQEIISKIKIDDKKIKEEINNKIKTYGNIETISQFFMDCLTNITGIPFSKKIEKIEINGDVFSFKIQDSSLYKEYEKFILNHEVFKAIIRKQRKQKEMVRKHKNEEIGIKVYEGTRKLKYWKRKHY